MFCFVIYIYLKYSIFPAYEGKYCPIIKIKANLLCFIIHCKIYISELENGKIFMAVLTVHTHTHTHTHTRTRTHTHTLARSEKILYSVFLCFTGCQILAILVLRTSVTFHLRLCWEVMILNTKLSKILNEGSLSPRLMVWGY
jgi:hypothetical protein